MKTKFSFTEDHRSLELIPENPLEQMVLDEISDRCGRGSMLKIKKIHSEVDSFIVEMNVNGG